MTKSTTQSSIDPVIHPSILRPPPPRKRNVGGKHPPCPIVKGLWPEVSRTRLAEAVGTGVGHVSKYLSGKMRMPMVVAVRTAPLLGMTVEELWGELERARLVCNGKRTAVKAKRK